MKHHQILTEPTIVRLNCKSFPMSEAERRILSSLGGTLREIEGTRPEEIIRVAGECDAMIVVSAFVQAPVIQALKRCRILSRMGIGTDRIDLTQATRSRIIVTNVPDFCTREVADHTIALVMAIARKLPEFGDLIRSGKGFPFFTDIPSLRRLDEMTLGIVGFGRIGKAVAHRAKAFGFSVLVNDPQVTKTMAKAEQVVPVDLDTLLRSSDYICLQCPLLDSTRHMLTLREFQKMKRSAVLINTSRGDLVKEADLIQALRTGLIRYAALDVFSELNVTGPKGFSTRHPLLKLKNVILTPHVAAISKEAIAESQTTSAQAVVDVLTGHWPKHPVNPNVKPQFPLKQRKEVSI